MEIVNWSHTTRQHHQARFAGSCSQIPARGRVRPAGRRFSALTDPAPVFAGVEALTLELPHEDMVSCDIQERRRRQEIPMLCSTSRCLNACQSSAWTPIARSGPAFTSKTQSTPTTDKAWYRTEIHAMRDLENVSPTTDQSARKRCRFAARMHGKFVPMETMSRRLPVSHEACVHFAPFGSLPHMHNAGTRDWIAAITSINQAHSSSGAARVCLVSCHPTSCSRAAMALQMQQMQMQQQQLQQHQLQQQQLQQQQLQQQQLQQQQMQQQQQQQMQQLQQQRQMQQMQQHPQMQQQQQPHMQQNQANFGGAKGGAGCKGGMPGKGGQGPARPPAPPPPPGAPGPSAQPRATGPGLTVTGCNNDTVRNLINGSYSVTGENHGKPMWKKDLRLQPECLAVSTCINRLYSLSRCRLSDLTGPLRAWCPGLGGSPPRA
eukprot:s1600_g8.t1